MTEIRDRIEGLFCSALEAEPSVSAVGLRAQFKREVNLADGMRIHQSEGVARFRFRHEALCDLADEFGVLSLTNVFLGSAANLDLSGSNSYVTVGTQDPFHFDPLDGVTMLQKPKAVTRDIPTYYALAGEVRKAIGQLDRTGLSKKICAALDLMQEDDYMFSVDGAELKIRGAVQFDMPEFSRLVFDLVAEEFKFARDWTSGMGEAVIHSNRPDFIVHGRPASNSDLNNMLKGIHIER